MTSSTPASGGDAVPPTAALLLVDIQVGFCPGGNLPVAGGDEVVPVANRWIDRFWSAGRPILLTRDWHPADHVSFRSRGGPWPPHCVQGTRDAEFHPGLTLPPVFTVVSKAMDPDREAYSDFEGTRLAEELRARGVDTLYIAGLATDYCVHANVLDARRAGFRVRVIRDGIRAVEVNPGDGERALREMREAGAEFV